MLTKTDNMVEEDRGVTNGERAASSACMLVLLEASSTCALRG